MKIILADKNDTRFLASLIAAVIDKAMAARHFVDDRQVYFDILAKVDGIYVNFEIQLSYQKYYDLRCFWHISSIFYDNANTAYFGMKGEGKTKIGHNEFFEKMPKLTSINFCGFNIDKG